MPISGRRTRVAAILGVVVLVTAGINLIGVGAAGASIVTSQASLVNGVLTIVGSGALPRSTVTVDNFLPTGRADGKGNFTISAGDFSEPSCVATLYDGSVSVEVTLSGCTPTIAPTFPVPASPSPLGPAPGAQTLEPVTLSWQPPPVPSGVSYRWQVTTHRSSGAVVSTATVGRTTKSTTLSGLAPGTYYWRVQSVRFPPEPYFPLFGQWTAWRSLTITGEATGTPGSPTILTPAGGTEYHPDESYPIQWTTAAGAASYRLQLAKKPSFAPGTVLIDVPESGTLAQAPLMQFQTPLYIRVFAVNAAGVQGLPSATVAIALTYTAPVPPPPTPRAPANGATVLLPVTLKWKADPNPQIEGYQLEINSTPDFSAGCGGVEECVTGLTQPRDILFSLPAGTRYWRVRSFHGLAGRDRGAVTNWSAARHFTVSSAPPQVRTLSVDVFTGGGTALRSHTHIFSGTNEDNEAFGIVQLTTPAPAGGTTITLTSSNPKAASLRTSIHIGAGQAQGSFRIKPLQVSSPATLTLSATLAASAATAPLTVDPASINQVFPESNQKEDGSSVPNFFSGGTDLVATMLFNGNAPGGSLISLASSSPAASVPHSVTATGQLESFSITTQPVTSSTPVVITATWRAKTVKMRMTLQPPPTLLAPAPGTSFPTGGRVAFYWHTPAGLSSELQVADNAAFTSPVVDFNTDTSMAWAFTSLPSGTLYWRVLGVDVYGADGPASAVRTLIVRPPRGPLPAPAPEFPTDGASLSAGQLVSFLWTTVNGAASYELQVATSSTFARPLVLERTPTGNQVNTSRLPVGTFYWRVRAVDATRPGLWSVTFHLTITST